MPYTLDLSNKNTGKTLRIEIYSYSSLSAFEPLDQEYHGNPDDASSANAEGRGLDPDLIILAFSIDDPRSMQEIRSTWYPLIGTKLSSNDSAQVMLLGLKRDIRSISGASPREFVDPLEGHRHAQEMRCDAYTECSAMTGELMHLVKEDVVKLVLKAKGQRESTGPKEQEDWGSCLVM